MVISGRPVRFVRGAVASSLALFVVVIPGTARANTPNVVAPRRAVARTFRGIASHTISANYKIAGMRVRGNCGAIYLIKDRNLPTSAAQTIFTARKHKWRRSRHPSRTCRNFLTPGWLWRVSSTGSGTYNVNVDSPPGKNTITSFSWSMVFGKKQKLSLDAIDGGVSANSGLTGTVNTGVCSAPFAAAPDEDDPRVANFWPDNKRLRGFRISLAPDQIGQDGCSLYLGGRLVGEVELKSRQTEGANAASISAHFDQSNPDLADTIKPNFENDVLAFSGTLQFDVAGISMPRGQFGFTQPIISE